MRGCRKGGMLAVGVHVDENCARVPEGFQGGEAKEELVV